MKKQILRMASITASMILLCSCGGGSSSSHDAMYGVTNGTVANSKSAFLESANLDNFSDFGGISGDSYEGGYEYYEYSEPQDVTDQNVTSEAEEYTYTENVNREKLVYEATSSIEVKNFDEAVAGLKVTVQQLKGIVQSEDYWDDAPYEFYTDSYNGRKISGYKRFRTVVRIPTSEFDSFIHGLSSLGHVKNTTSKVSNITQQYYSSKSYLESYQNQLEVLQEMYSRTGTITEMLEIEARISEVQAEINNLTTKIQSMDMDVAYSTVTINIEEVTEYSDTPREYQELSFFDKLSQRFQNSWEGFLDFLEETLYFFIDVGWYLIILAIILYIWIKVRRKKGKTSIQHIFKHRHKSDASKDSVLEPMVTGAKLDSKDNQR